MSKNYGEVIDYKFHNFTEKEVEANVVTNYDFKSFGDSFSAGIQENFQKIIKKERTDARNNSFKINPLVEKHRGIRDQEEREYEENIEREVQKRISEIQDEAFKVGFDEGVNQGREEIFNEMRNVVDQKLDTFSLMISDVLRQQEDILTNQKQEIYVLLRNLSKWIVLRELKEDGKYIERLLEKLLLEIQVRSNLLIQVNGSDFNDMPEVLEHIQSRLGEMKNVRVEVDPSIATQGMIIETENGIINASMEEQFRNLDKLFEDVIVEN